MPLVTIGSLVQFLLKLGMGNIDINYRRHVAGYSSTRTMLNLDSESAESGDGQFRKVFPKIRMEDVHANYRKHLTCATTTLLMVKLDCEISVSYTHLTLPTNREV